MARSGKGPKKNSIKTNGTNIRNLRQDLLTKMDPTDAERVTAKARELLEELPSGNRQGLLLGLVQSGKTVAIATSVAMAADNDYSCFIVLTSDNTWLYNQTVERLKTDLPRLQVEEKGAWPQQEMLMQSGLDSTEGKALVLVATKNATVLSRLLALLGRLREERGGELPTALIIDDEADQASLDTQKSRRVKKPDLEPGRINSLITAIRDEFDSHVYLQVTATPQALFLQEEENPYRPEFTIVLEPGNGYIGGNTFFSLIEGETRNLIRRIDQAELDSILDPASVFSADNIESIPESLRTAICVFYIGATIKYLQKRRDNGVSTSYSFLCHISEKMKDHDQAAEAISQYYAYLLNGLSDSAPSSIRQSVREALRSAYNEVMTTFSEADSSDFTFAKVFDSLKDFIAGTDIQTINSSALQQRPSYSRRYNILIGGTKLSRGVTIDGLIVTYYGRRAKRPNIDTMLQHARMYGYRGADLDITRLYVTADVETRFRLINESEEALREVIQNYPNKEYRGIRIGRNLNATRRNVLNPNNTGAYAAGKSYFPRRPVYSGSDVQRRTEQLNRMLEQLDPSDTGEGVEITIDQMIELINLTSSESVGIGLWEDKRIITALETLKNDPSYDNKAHLIVRRDRRITPNQEGYIGALVGGAARGQQGDLRLAKRNIPTLFMYRLRGDAPSAPGERGWAGQPFWVPNVRFPDGEYALIFNFD